MGDVVGELLPLGLGVALSPVPIIAVILMLLSAHARSASLAFLVGWLLGIATVVTVVALVVDPVDGGDTEDPSVLASTLKLVLGVAALLLAGKQWRSRPKPGEAAALPGWMTAVDSITPAKSLGLGAALAAVNPKNLTLCLAGGVAIGAGGLPGGETAVAVAVFVVVGSLSIAVPVVGYLVAEQRMRRPLDELREWLTAHSSAVMAVLLLVIGTSLVGKGLAGY